MVISIQGEAIVPLFNNSIGFGFSLKGAYGIGKSAQLTILGGISKFNSTNTDQNHKLTTRLIPVLFGYKHNLGNIFIEPRIGIGEMGGKIFVNGDYYRQSVAAIFGSLGAGYRFERFTLWVNILRVRGIENADAGTWHSRSFSYTSIGFG